MAQEKNLLPHGLTEDAVMAKDVPKGIPLTYEDVLLDKNYIATKFKSIKI